MAHVIEAYIAGWNETDPARRPELIERAWIPDATSLDPLMSGEGRSRKMAACAVTGFSRRQPDGCRSRVRSVRNLHEPVGVVVSFKRMSTHAPTR